jgi:hypothetical protein
MLVCNYSSRVAYLLSKFVVAILLTRIELLYTVRIMNTANTTSPSAAFSWGWHQSFLSRVALPVGKCSRGTMRVDCPVVNPFPEALSIECNSQGAMKYLAKRVQRELGCYIASVFDDDETRFYMRVDVGVDETSSPPGSEELKKLARLLMSRQALANEQGISNYDLPLTGF